MKKLFILLILSFLSAQGLAAGCPDGSEPIKSVSADGSYFVYNCVSGNENSSSSAINSKAVAGIDIVNDPNIDFFRPPRKPYPTGNYIGLDECGRWQILIRMDIVMCFT